MFKFILGFFAGILFAVCTVFLGAVGYVATIPPPKNPSPYRPKSPIS